MRIIETRTAPNPRRVRIFLSEKQIAVPFEEVEIMQGELRTPEFSSVNPWQRVPVLILDDGTAISESVAICRYFEELQSEPALFGRGAVGGRWSRCGAGGGSSGCLPPSLPCSAICIRR